MASCLLCTSLQSLQSNRSLITFTTKEDAQSHASQHFHQMKIFDEDCTSLDQVVEQCLLKFAVHPSMEKKKAVSSAGSQSVLDLCRSLFEERVSKASPRVTCQKCGTGIALIGTKRGLKLEIAIEHASAHLGIDLFTCRKCGCSFRCKWAIKRHLKTSHHSRCVSENYTDKSDDFLDEITASINQCFSGSIGSSGSKTSVIRLKSVSNVQAKTKGSKLAVERQLFCNQLITRQRAGGDDGKIQCRLCPKKIKCKQETGCRAESVMQHVRLHLKKPFYRCKVCSNVFNSRSVLHNHLKSKHALTVPGNYESLADKYHDEIINMLRDCYGDESDK